MKSFIFINLSHVFVNCPSTLTENDERHYCNEALKASGLQDINDTCEILEYNLYRFNCVLQYKLGLFVSPRFIDASAARNSVMHSLKLTILSGEFDPFMNNSTEIAVDVELLNASSLAASPSPKQINPQDINVDSLIATIVIACFAVVAGVIFILFIFTIIEENQATKTVWKDWLKARQECLEEHHNVQEERLSREGRTLNAITDAENNQADSTVSKTPNLSRRKNLTIHTFTPPLLNDIEVLANPTMKLQRETQQLEASPSSSLFSWSTTQKVSSDFGSACDGKLDP